MFGIETGIHFREERPFHKICSVVGLDFGNACLCPQRNISILIITYGWTGTEWL